MEPATTTTTNSTAPSHLAFRSCHKILFLGVLLCLTRVSGRDDTVFRLPRNRIPVLPKGKAALDFLASDWMTAASHQTKPKRLGSPAIATKASRSNNVTAALVESMNVLAGFDDATTRNLTLLAQFTHPAEQTPSNALPDFQRNGVAYPLDQRSKHYLHLSDGDGPEQLRRKTAGTTAGRTAVALKVVLLLGSNSPHMRPEDVLEVTVPNGSFAKWVSRIDGGAEQQQHLMLDVEDDEHGQVELRLRNDNVQGLVGISIFASTDHACVLFHLDNSEELHQKPMTERWDAWQFDWVDEHMFQTLMWLPVARNPSRTTATSLSFAVMPSYQRRGPNPAWATPSNTRQALIDVGAVEPSLASDSPPRTKTHQQELKEFELRVLNEDNDDGEVNDIGIVNLENSVMIELHEIGSATVLSEFSNARVLYRSLALPAHTCEGNGHLSILTDHAFRMTASCIRPPCGFYCRVAMDMLPGGGFSGGLTVEYSSSSSSATVETAPVLVRTSFDQSDVLRYVSPGSEVYVSEMDDNESWVLATTQSVAQVVINARAPTVEALAPLQEAVV